MARTPTEGKCQVHHQLRMPYLWILRMSSPKKLQISFGRTSNRKSVGRCTAAWTRFKRLKLRSKFWKMIRVCLHRSANIYVIQLEERKVASRGLKSCLLPRARRCATGKNKAPRRTPISTLWISMSRKFSTKKICNSYKTARSALPQLMVWKLRSCTKCSRAVAQVHPSTLAPVPWSE